MSGDLEDKTCQFLAPPGLFRGVHRTEAGNIVDPLSRMQDIFFKVASQCNDINGPEPEPLPASPHPSIDELDYFSATIDEQADYDMLAFGSTFAMYARRALRSKGIGMNFELVRLLGWVIINLRRYKEPEQIPMCVAFAFRLQGLIAYITRDVVDEARTMLGEVFKTTEVQLSDLFKLLSSKSALFQSTNAAITEQLAQFCQQLLTSLPCRDKFAKGNKDQLKWWLPQAAILAWGLWQGVATITVHEITCSSVMGYLANTVDICKSQGVLSTEWADLDFFVVRTSENFVYLGPKVSRASRDRYLHQLAYKSGLVESVNKKSSTETTIEYVAAKRKSRLINRPHFPQLELWPLLGILRSRMFNDNLFRDCSSEQLRLFLRAVTVSEVIGEPPRPVKFDFLEGNIHLTNHAALSSQLHRGPKLQIPHLLALMRRRLRTELPNVMFDFLAFQKGCIHLAALLGQAKAEAISHKFKTGVTSGSALDKAQSTAFGLGLCLEIMTKSGYGAGSRASAIELLRDVGKRLTDWIEQKGDVGIRGNVRNLSCKLDTRRLCDLKPSFLSKLDELHNKYGTMDDLYTSDQREGIASLQETGKLKDVMENMFGKESQSTRKGE